MSFYFEYNFPIGVVNISETDGKIDGIYFGEYNSKTGASKAEKDVIKQAAEELTEYFSGRRKAFDVPLAPRGTDFQMRVWSRLQQIPYGETCSYKDIAIGAGVPKGFRAVGLANNKNPISLIIPCHRVIGASGKLVGYGGGLHIKKYLLELETKFK